MFSFLSEKLSLIPYAWPPVLLLTVIWTALAIIFIFVRYQLKKESKEMKEFVSNISREELKAFRNEVDELAKYVSKLPRPKNIIKEYKREEFENESD